MGTLSEIEVNDLAKEVDEFERSGSEHTLARFLGVLHDAGTLFPIARALNYCEENRAALRLLRDKTDFLSDELVKVAEFHSISIKSSCCIAMKRIFFMLGLSTTIRGLEDISYDVWECLITVLKDRNTQYREELKFRPNHISALRKIASYLDAHQQSGSTGYTNTLKVYRSSKEKKEQQLPYLPLEDAKRYSEWMAIFYEHISRKKYKAIKGPRSAFRLFLRWLENYSDEVAIRPSVFLSAYRGSPSFLEFVKTLYGNGIPTSVRGNITMLENMVDSYIEEELTIIEGDDRTLLGFSLLTARERRELMSSAVGSSDLRVQSTSNALPLRYIRELQKILTDDDWAWPKSQDSQYFYTNVDGDPQRIWNPVCSYLIYAMTEIPWRRIQFRCLDSGEGDYEKYDHARDKWVLNDSIHAGHWKRTNARRQARGVLNRRNGEFCFYVNTNKIADRNSDHGEMSGYFVPWKHAVAIRLLSDLRCWQEKYNPLISPTSYSDVAFTFHGQDRPADSVLRNIPDRFYLFRDPQGAHSKQAPPTDNRLYALWRLLMNELEQRLRAKGDDTTIITLRTPSGNPLTSYYNMHGLRVSGLTAFAEAGVPINILSKIVAGHASILMTIYYLQYSAAHVTDALTDARLRIEGMEAKDFGRRLRQQSIDSAMQIAVANNDDVIRGVCAGDVSTDLFFDTGLGICPYNGTRCHDGGPVSSTRAEPVPGGAKNCLRCRHFISGEPWLVPLALNQQLLAAKASDASIESENLNKMLDNLEGDRARLIRDSGIESIPISLSRKISHAEQKIEKCANELNEILLNMNAGHVIIDKIRSVREDDISSTTGSFVSHQKADVIGYRSGTRFELLDSILQASRVYPVLSDEAFEAERRSYIDAILYNNNMRPLSLLALSEEDRRRAADAASEWLIRKLGAQETDLLISGAQTLTEMNIDPQQLHDILSSHEVSDQKVISNRDHASRLPHQSSYYYQQQREQET